MHATLKSVDLVGVRVRFETCLSEERLEGSLDVLDRVLEVQDVSAFLVRIYPIEP